MGICLLPPQRGQRAASADCPQTSDGATIAPPSAANAERRAMPIATGRGWKRNEWSEVTP
jgi:hypothetical protein